MNTEQKGWRERFIEEGARLEHARWSRWQQYVHDKCELLGDGSLKIPKALADRWTHQISRDYKHLSEQEKESDRKEVLEYLPLIERTLQEQREEMVKFIKSGRIAIANIGTTERPEYIFHIPGKVLDDALIKDTKPQK